MKYLPLLLIAASVIACKEKYKPDVQNEPAIYVTNVDSTIVTTIHNPKPIDTVNLSAYGDSLDGLLKRNLLDYYKAGWMDGSNAVIGLYNEGRMHNNFVYSLRKKDWAIMKKQIYSK